MRKGTWAGICLAGLAITGCSRGPTLQVDPWDERTGATARTVAITGGERAIVFSERYAEVPASAFYESALEALAARGFQRSEAGTADLWLRPHLLLLRGGGRGNHGGGRMGGAHHSGHGGEEGEGREGRAPEGGEGRARSASQVEILLELVRRDTGERVWSGSAMATLGHPFWSPEGRTELAALTAQLLAPVHGAAMPR